MGNAVQAVNELFATLDSCGDWADEQKHRFKEQFHDELMRLAQQYEAELEAARQALNDNHQ